MGDMFEEIRKKKNEEILRTGRRWIVTRQNIPQFQDTTESVLKTLQHVEELAPEILDEIEVLNLLDSKRISAKEFMKKYSITEEPVMLPEGLETVAFELVDESNAEQVETMFLAMVKDTHEFRSAVNIGDDVRTVMYEKGKKYGGTPVRVSTVSKEMAWSLQQTIDWCYTKQIQVVAVRRKGAIVEIGYIKKGIPEPPSRETYIHYFEKTDGWTIEKHER